MRVLHFIIDAPMQSWGESSSWSIRDSSDFPTKSGIVGMIGAAMGLSPDDPLIGGLCETVDIGFKTKRDHTPQLDDFQTVDYFGGIRADGKVEDNRNNSTIVQHKYYIVDRKFLVVIASNTDDDSILDDIQNAMLDPVWPMHLGRACCAPSYPMIPVIETEYDSVEEALRMIPLYADDAKFDSNGNVIEIPEVIQVESAYGQRRTDVREARSGKHYQERFVEVKAV